MPETLIDIDISKMSMMQALALAEQKSEGRPFGVSLTPDGMKMVVVVR